MANLQNFRHNNHVGLLENVGQKVKNAAEIAGAVKGAWNVGKMIYSGFQVVAPYLEMAMMAGL